MKILLSVLLLALVSCANKTPVTEVQSNTANRKIAVHVEDSDLLINIGTGVTLQLNKNINVKPNTYSFVLFQSRADSAQLTFNESKEFDRELKSGAVFEIDQITEKYWSDSAFYSISLKINTQASKIYISVKGTDRRLTVGDFKVALKEYFKVIQPPPVEMK